MKTQPFLLTTVENYRYICKTHPVAEERLLLHKGKDYPVFETAIGKIGMLICYDLAFPEAMAILVEKEQKSLLSHQPGVPD